MDDICVNLNVDCNEGINEDNLCNDDVALIGRR